MPLRAVFFDLGDTIPDLGEGRGDYEAILAVRVSRVYDILLQAGHPLPDRERFCSTLARDSEERYQQALVDRRGLDIFDVLLWFCERWGLAVSDETIKTAGAAYCQAVTAARPLRLGAQETLRALADKGLQLGLISNTLQPGRFLDSVLSRHGLLDLFAVRVYSSDVRFAKPHPVIFQAALTALGLQPVEAVHVGDRLEADIAGAQGVGIKAVLISVAHRPEQRSTTIPDARIAELPDLLDVLPRLSGS